MYTLIVKHIREYESNVVGINRPTRPKSFGHNRVPQRVGEQDYREQGPAAKLIEVFGRC